jgi:hypothetical protein
MYLFIHSFVHSPIYFFIHPFFCMSCTYSSIYFLYLLIYSYVNLFILSFIYASIYSLVYMYIYLFHSLHFYLYLLIFIYLLIYKLSHLTATLYSLLHRHRFPPPLLSSNFLAFSFCSPLAFSNDYVSYWMYFHIYSQSFYHWHVAVKLSAFLLKKHPHSHLPILYTQVPPTYSSVRLHGVICWQSEPLRRHLCRWCFLLILMTNSDALTKIIIY